MEEHKRRYFYWPSITVDSLKHIKSCIVCQKKDRRNQIVTVPSELVAIDIVGPFPVVKVGLRHLLT